MNRDDCMILLKAVVTNGQNLVRLALLYPDVELYRRQKATNDAAYEIIKKHLDMFPTPFHY